MPAAPWRIQNYEKNVTYNVGRLRRRMACHSLVGRFYRHTVCNARFIRGGPACGSNRGPACGSGRSPGASGPGSGSSDGGSPCPGGCGSASPGPGSSGSGGGGPGPGSSDSGGPGSGSSGSGDPGRACGAHHQCRDVRHGG